MDDDPDFGDVQTLLNGDLDGFEGELGELYNEIDRYSRVADALDTAGRSEDAEYFRELALDSYQSFVYVIRMKKDLEEGQDVLGDRYEF